MRRTIFATIFQLLAAVVIILSFQPCLAFFLGKDLDSRPYGYYERTYWSYLVIRSLLIALAGIGIGVVLLWLGGCIKSGGLAKHNSGGLLRFSVKGIAFIVSLMIGAILVFVFLPGLSDFWGRHSSDYHEPADNFLKPAPGMVFMVMSNDLTTPHIEFRPPDNGSNLWLESNASISFPRK